MLNNSIKNRYFSSKNIKSFRHYITPLNMRFLRTVPRAVARGRTRRDSDRPTQKAQPSCTRYDVPLVRRYLSRRIRTRE